MKRIRLSTLLLLIVITALCLALVVQQERASRRENQIRAELKRSQYDLNTARKYVADMHLIRNKRMQVDVTNKQEE
jgi:hypothetical protein